MNRKTRMRGGLHPARRWAIAAVLGCLVGVGVSTARATSPARPADALPQGSFTREPNMDRSGSDIRKIELDAGQDVGACEDLCRSMSDCAAFTYVKRSVTVPRPICWLKDKAATAYESSCCTSGVRAK